MKPHYSNTNNPIDFPKSKNKMNERIEHCLYQAGLTAQGCWDELDDYTKQSIEKFAELIVEECIVKAEEEAERYLGFPNLENANMYAKVMYNYQELLKENFGVEE